VIGAVFGALLLAVAVMRKSSELGKVAFAFLSLLGAISVVVFLTGERAEELVEKLPGFSQAITERHEEAALVAIAMASVGGLALVALRVVRRRPLPRWLAATGLIASVAVAGLMGYTANLGGQVRHTEIRAGAAASDAPASSPGAEDRERRER
jgi:hypothetical protein